MNRIKKILEVIKGRWKPIYITYKILFTICMLSFFTIIVSVFDPNLDATGNLVIIRTAFSSIIGFLLESSTKTVMICNDKSTTFRNTVVGIVSILITIVIIICYVYEIDPDNPSLILLKNVLFSCIGFLISASKDCAK